MASMTSDVTQNLLKQKKSKEKLELANVFLYFGRFF